MKPSRPMPSGEWAFAFSLTLLLALLAIPALVRAREASRRSTCVNHLKHMGLVFKMYSSEARGGEYPPLSPWLYNWMPDVPRLMGNYMNSDSLTWLACPGREKLDPSMTPPECVESSSYVYTRYPLRSDEAAAAFRAAYDANPAPVIQGERLLLPVSMAGDGVISQSEIPMLWDRVPLEFERWAHRWPQGGNVLYMDGHVEFLAFEDQQFPITSLSARLFGDPLPQLPRTCH